MLKMKDFKKLVYDSINIRSARDQNPLELATYNVKKNSEMDERQSLYIRNEDPRFDIGMKTSEEKTIEY
ncbi:hypothetical protein V3C99_005225 [Haemonchus contortus]